MISRGSINSMKQNKTRLIADDFEALGVPREKTHEILLSRGVYKWLAARRDVIHFRHALKDAENIIFMTLKAFKIQFSAGLGSRKLAMKKQQLKGMLKAVQSVKKDLGKITHSDRLRAPDNDAEAQKFVTKVLREDF